MGMRFRKSFGKGPFKVTLSKSGVGYSVGTKGFRVTKKAGGGMRTTTSIPGTGISYVKDSGSGKNSGAKRNQQVTHAIPTNISVAPEDKNLAGYCKHCYRKIDDATICPACGKSQYEKVKQPAENKQAIWCMVCLIAGFILLKSAAILSFILFAVAIILAVDMAKTKKEKAYIVPKAPPVQPSSFSHTAAPEVEDQVNNISVSELNTHAPNEKLSLDDQITAAKAQVIPKPTATSDSFREHVREPGANVLEAPEL